MDNLHQHIMQILYLQVFQKIQGRINKGLSKHTAQELEQRLAKQYQDYLHTLNTKAGVFRDTIIESDYNPLEPRYAYLICCCQTKCQPRSLRVSMGWSVCPSVTGRILFDVATLCYCWFDH